MSSARPARSPGSAEALLPLALSRPDDAARLAHALLAGRPDPAEASMAHQALGIVHRDRGDLPHAIADLRTGVALAVRSGQSGRTADVRATLGLTLILAGRIQRGLAEFERAVDGARGGLLGRILYRRALAYWELGQPQLASRDLSAAMPLLRGDDIWQARALNVRHLLSLLSGAVSRASADLDLAEKLFERAGQEFECAVARHNRGMVAVAQGDLHIALVCFDDAARRYAAVGTVVPELALDRSGVLLSAGLASDALQVADEAVEQMPTEKGRSLKRAELLYAGAAAALAVPDLPAAIDRAQRASRMFRAQGRELWQARSGLVLAAARYRSGVRSGQLLTQIQRLAEPLGRHDGEMAQRAHLLAGRLALDLRRTEDANVHLSRAAGTRRSAPPQTRSLGWLARALWAQAQDDTGGALTAARRGLDALQEHQLRLGSTELRAHATRNGAELAGISLRAALGSQGSAAQRGLRLLIATERWRATVQSLPNGHSRAIEVAGVPDKPDVAVPLTALRAVTRQLERNGTSSGTGVVAAVSGSDPAMTEPLAALRAVARQIETERAAGSPTAWLERERRRLEGEIRARAMHAAGGRRQNRRQLDVAKLAEALGERRLVELVEVDGVLHVLTFSHGRVRRCELGAVPTRLVDHARFLLRRAARGRVSGAAELLNEIGRRLEEALIGPALDGLAGDGPVVIVPPGNLQAVPWALLPSLRSRVVSVAPSAMAFMRARELVPGESAPPVFVAGPGLDAGSGEVSILAREYPGALVLEGHAAAADPVLAALDGTWLAHIAAHGSFRLDNPLFSALHLDDGPLTVHDFERLRQAPYRLILPCCDSGLGAPVGADELLGLVSSLMPLGSAGILASVVPINDAATVPLMVALHAALRSGADLPSALLAARQQTTDDSGGDLVTVATGLSFTAFGT